VARSQTILLVEDDPNDVLLIRKAIQQSLAGIPLAVVGNGEEGMRYLRGEGVFADRTQYPFPEIVLLDLKMPLMNGFELLRWVRSQPNLKRLPVIIFTGSVQDSDSQMAFEHGANSYIVKPSEFNQMAEAVRNVGEFWLKTTMLPDLNA